MESKSGTYTVLFAEDVPDDPDWSSIVCRRIVSIAAPDGRVIAHDIPLDNSYLRYGGDEERRLCDTAPKLLAALKRIAAMPLWGEPIPPGDIRNDYVFAGEYDIGEDSFNPSCDTESTQLRDAVEEARAVLAALEGGDQ
jgi:hypothetical protein